jgi:thiol:disulfide interchange protein DsbC
MRALNRSGIFTALSLVLGLALVSGFALRCSAAPESPTSSASSASASSAQEARAALAAKFGANPANVRDTPVPGVFEVSDGVEVLYVSADGKYMFAGDLYDLNTRGNLTDVRKAGIRKTLLAAVRDEDTIPFLAAAPKYELYVFTDVDCAYCRRLHAQMAELNKLGISIRYLAFPRTGPGTESALKLESVWCSANRQQSLTTAKNGAAVAKATCKNPVDSQYQLGAAVGLEGTPALYTKSGVNIRNGSVQDILAQLQKAGG